MSFESLTIRTKLLWLTLGFIIPLVLAGFFNLWSFWLASRAQLDESLVQQAQIAATGFEQQLIAQKQTLETVSLLARGGIESNFTLREYLDSIVKTRPDWLDIQIVNQEGNLVLAQSSKPSSLPVDSVQNIKEEAERENAFVVSVEQTADKLLHLLSIAQPLGNGNFVVARVDVTSANTLFESLTLPDENIIAVFDRNNRLVYRNRSVPDNTSNQVIEIPLFAALKEKREGIIEVVSPYDQIERIYGIAPVNPGDYVVAVGVPSSRLYEPARVQFARQAFFGLLIASLAIAAAFGFARNIAKPLHQLTLAAKSFGDGDTSARTDITGGGSIRELGKTFNRMADQIAEREEKLKELDRLRSEFVSSVSHELRTPLTTIKTLTRVLNSNRISVDERAEYLQTIADECDRQIEFVQNLLDLTRLESGAFRISLARVDIVKLLSEVVRTNERIARSHDLDLVFLPPKHALAPALADAAILRQIVVSIIANAMKYTTDDGTITLSVAQVDDRIEIGIADDGCGIVADDIPHVFEKFFRGRPLPHSHAGDFSEDDSINASSNETEGVGLGLYLIKNLVQQSGGKISIESPVEGEEVGTKVSIVLPIADHEGA